MSLEEPISSESFGASIANLTVFVIDRDPRMRTRLAMQLGEITNAASFSALDGVSSSIVAGQPTIMVLGPSFSSPEDMTAVGSLCRSYQNVESVLVVDELSTAALQHAIRAGVCDVVAALDDNRQLIEAVERAASQIPESFVPVASAVSPEHQSSELGRAVTVFSTKGGAGKSVIAVNLAVTLAKKSTRPVVLLDADLQFGDIAVMLKLTPQHTIVDAVSNIDRLDNQLLRSLLVKHEPSGVLVLPAPTEPAFADQVDAATMSKIVSLLREFCDYIVIDTPSHFNEVVLALIEASDDIVLVAGMDIPNIKNVKIGLQVLRLLDVPSTKLKLVLNRSNSKVKLDISEVERTLQLKADCLVPSDMLIPQSVNKGVPAVLEAPKSGVTRSIEQLVGLIESDRQAAQNNSSQVSQ